MTLSHNRCETSNCGRKGGCQNLFKRQRVDVQGISRPMLEVCPPLPSLISPLVPTRECRVSLLLGDPTILLQKKSDRGPQRAYEVLEILLVLMKEFFNKPSDQLLDQSTIGLPRLDLHYLLCRFLWLLVAAVFYFLDSVSSYLDT